MQVRLVHAAAAVEVVGPDPHYYVNGPNMGIDRTNRLELKSEVLHCLLLHCCCL